MNQFDDVVYNNIPRNTFDLSNDRKFSFNMGELVPILTQEVVPGDTFSIREEHIIRVAPLVSPVMHRVNVSTHYFFVPNRLLWAGWEDFISNPTDPTNPAPQFNTDAPTESGSIMDYLGYPTGEVIRFQNPMPISAYNLIWNEYYRDQNLQQPKAYELIDGSNFDPEIVGCQATKPYKRAWQKDYFTSALPFPQKGEPVSIGIGGTADVKYKSGITPIPTVKDFNGNPVGYANKNLIVDANGELRVDDVIDAGARLDNSGNLEVDLASSSAITIEQLRRATRLQQWLEINARSGTRYVENIMAHFGVKSQDSRLQRPEYLGGGKSNISFSEVLQMSASDTVTPQGNMSGHGINVGNSANIKNTFQEHGFIIGIMSVLPDTAYMNPSPKWTTRFDPLEYLWPTFAQLGEQPVLNYELNGESNDEIFGYQSRYADYKFNHNTVHGDFKGNLDFWHMSRKIEGNPLLNSNFIEADPTTRIYAVEEANVDKLYCQLYHRISAQRPLPRNNIPTI